MSGNLYIVATPIGNLEDITLRALRVLEEVDLIAAEDTRRTKKLLSHFEISTRLESYHSHNEHRKTDTLLERINDGLNVAVVSDAGTPCIADPGFLMVREALKMDIEPIVIPGVSSLTFAIAAAGLPVDKFTFYGFLPVKQGRRRSALQKIAEGDISAVIFESPYRMNKLIDGIVEEIGPDTIVAVTREATKVHEEIIRATASEIQEMYKEKKWRGECVVVVSK